MIHDLYKEGFTQNRELSWLKFNERVLEQAEEPANPLLERMKFISIFSSNLDEFFRVRVGALTDMMDLHPEKVDDKSGLSAEQQIDAIYDEAERLCRKRARIYSHLIREYRKIGIEDVSVKSLNKADQKYLKDYFARNIMPHLGARIVDAKHPMPVLQSGMEYCMAILEYQGHGIFAFTPMPSQLPNLIPLPRHGKGKFRFVHLSDLIAANMSGMFGGARLLETTNFILLRSAEFSKAESDSFDDITDYREKMENMVEERRKLDIVRLEFFAEPSTRMRRYLYSHLHIHNKHLVTIAEMPLNRKIGYELPKILPVSLARRYSYPPYTPKLTPELQYRKPIFEQILRKDVLLHYPYASMDPFLELVKQCSVDPAVTSIQITIYRLASKARLVDFLCQAAENGKEVTVLIELKARFDEQNNIDYSERLEEAGCTILYGFEDYKVHSKVCLITKTKARKTQSVCLIATGNFNENTAKQYEDLALMTARPSILADVQAYFRNMKTGVLDGHYRYLLVAPVSLKPKLLELIHKEERKGSRGCITLKMNSITDEELIAALQKAAQAGNKVRMIVRGICCILPDITGKTENLQVISIVGRYLEHSRIYCFGSGNSAKVYISSADFMTRNTERRVEVGVPIYDPRCKKEIQEYLELCFADRVRARELRPDGSYHHIRDDMPLLDSQQAMMERTPASRETLLLPQKDRANAPIQPFKTHYSPK